MATKTSPSRRSSSRASSTRSKTSSRKAPARKRAAPRKPPRTPVHQILSPHARDAFGILLVVVALVAVLGLWFDSAGPVGDFLGWLFRGAWGVAAMLFPLVGVYWGVLLLRDTAREERVRMFIGFTVLCAGILGLLSLLGGDPAATAGYDAVSAAGGVMGALVAHPLAGVISPIGAAIVCLGLSLLGLLIFTGTPIASAWSHLHDFFTAADVEEVDEPEEFVVEAPAAPKVKKQRVRHLKEAFGLVEPEGRRARLRARRGARGRRRRLGRRGRRRARGRGRGGNRRRGASSTIPDGGDRRRALPAAAAGSAPRGAALDGRRCRPGTDARGARADAA